MHGKVVLVEVDRSPFSEYAWDEFESEMTSRDWSQLPQNTALFAAGVESDSSDSKILRSVHASIESAADYCGVSGCEATCVVADAPD